MKTVRAMGRVVLVFWLAFTSQSLAEPNLQEEDRPIRPNLLVLMAEDMSARVGAFGDPVAVTPNIDALAAEEPPYIPAFFMAAQQLTHAGRAEEAAGRLRAGIAAAERSGDAHAAAEMREFLSTLPAN